MQNNPLQEGEGNRPLPVRGRVRVGKNITVVSIPIPTIVSVRFTNEASSPSGASRLTKQELGYG